MPRILHVITGLTVGGAETALCRLVTASRGGDCTHAVVALTPGGVLAQRLHEAGVELTHFDFRAAPVSNFFGLLKLIRRTRPDIVQTWMYHADMLGGLAARLAGNRNIVWGIRVTELVGGDARATTLVRNACALLSRWVPHTIVCVAEAARRSHIRAGYDASRMMVIPNGFDLPKLEAAKEQRDALRSSCGFGPDDLVIGNIGRFNANKDQRNFVRAAGLLARSFGNARFLMVGRDIDAANSELADWIAQTGCAHRFALLGERTDVPACLAAMDVFCLSSRTEGFPNVVGEAMAMALPCVVTDTGDSAVLVGETGAVVPKEDCKALAEGMASLAALSPAARQQLGQRARARIQSEFTMEKARARFEAVYQDLMREAPQGRRQCAD